MNKKISAEHYFICKNGVVITSLEDLIREFEWYSRGASKDTFEFHAKNDDFAKWIKEVVKEEELAEKIRGKKDPAEIKKLFDEHESKGDSKSQKFDAKLPDKAEKLLERTSKMKKELNKNITPKEEKMESLMEKYNSLNSEISENRRLGKDVFITALKLRHAKSKIMYYEASNEESDYKYAIDVLNETKKDLNEAIKKEEVNVKKEILEEANKDLKVHKEV